MYLVYLVYLNHFLLFSKNLFRKKKLSLPLSFLVLAKKRNQKKFSVQKNIFWLAKVFVQKSARYTRYP
jgi:hypothetical protein